MSRAAGFQRLKQRGPSVVVALLLAAPLAAQDFWRHWGDGRAELNGYRLTQPRYGQLRSGSAVLIYVTEDFSDRLRVKADPGRHPAADTYPVLKLNVVRDFQTGIYDYNLMTSVFARVAPGWPIAKVSFSSQEWCGQVYHQLLPRAGAIAELSHSYFDGEADGSRSLPFPDGGVLEDALPILLRGWNSAYLGPGESRSAPFLGSLMRARLGHRPLDWGQATFERQAGTTRIQVPAGDFEVATTEVREHGGPTRLYQFEVRPPYRLVRWSVDDGEQAVLLGSTRLSYWKLNQEGGESYLRELGLRP